MQSSHSTNEIDPQISLIFIYTREYREKGFWALSHPLSLNYTTGQPVLLFSKFNKIFFGYFDPENILTDDENT